jgi:NAD(P)-dependent dehydrogenase (short-subunit alcohol dehydrogenase family)
VNDKTVVITGASDGIGEAGAVRLAAMGAKVVVVGRSPAKTKAVADRLQVPSYVADFSKLSDVRRLADELRQDLPRIDVLANNAGGIFANRELTVDGHEKAFQVNHLAPFLLTNLLMERLIASRASVINTSSVAHRLFSNFDVNDLEVVRNYSQRVAYGNSKLENILFTRELHRRYHDQGISTAAFHPGNVASNFASETNSLMRYVYHSALRRLFLISPDKGADTLVWLSTASPGTDWRSGEYYDKCKVAKASAQANDDDLALQLWEQSARYCAL